MLFDLDETLIPERPAIEKAFAAVAARVWGVSSPERIAALWEAARQVLREQAPVPEYLAAVHCGSTDLLHGSVSASGPQADALRAFLPHYLEHAFDPVLPAHAPRPARELTELWRETRLDALTVYRDSVEALTTISNHAPLALVTNGLSALQREKVAKTGLGGYFESILVAEEVGAGKPDRVMFEESVRRVGAVAGDAVMVGNDRDRDIAGSMAAGLDAVLVDRNGTSENGDAIADLTRLHERLESS